MIVYVMIDESSEGSGEPLAVFADEKMADVFVEGARAGRSDFIGCVPMEVRGDTDYSFLSADLQQRLRDVAEEQHLSTSEIMQVAFTNYMLDMRFDPHEWVSPCEEIEAELEAERPIQ